MLTSATSRTEQVARVHLMRHAESSFNVRYTDGHDPMDFDSRLTERGRRQAAAAAAAIVRLAPDVIVTSPLTRALETARIVAGERIPVVVTPLLRERLYNSCDVGRPAAQLVEEFPGWRFDLAEQWWCTPSVTVAPDHRGIVIEPEEHFLGRVAAFRTWVIARPEKRIVAVGHGTFFATLCQRELRNCGITRLSSSPAHDQDQKRL